MSKHGKPPILKALEEGRSYTWTVQEGGDLASMRKAIKHGQTLTMSPIANPAEIQVGDMVLVKWHQGLIFHIVGDIQGDQFLIVNSLGKVNGWVGAKEILGRITKIVEPEPRPDVPYMLEQLEVAFRRLIVSEQPADEQARRLYSIVEDLHWYAMRFGPERWGRLPRSNKWSFEQNLWKLTRQAREATSLEAEHLHSLIDSGKQCVGLAAEALSVFEGDEELI